MGKIHNNISEKSYETQKKYRDRIDLLRSRVSLLSGKDRLLMTMYLDNGNSIRQMARLAGVHDGNIARRICKITKRLTNGEYITCLKNRDKFTTEEMAIAKDYFLLGLSMKKIAGKQHLSYYRIREIIRKIRHIVLLVQKGG